METEPASGLTLDQIDVIDMQLGRIRALVNVLHEDSDDNDETAAFLFPMVIEHLDKVGELVNDCRIGGRPHD